MPPCFFILCGNSTHNRGDRVNLQAQIALLRTTFPGCGITAGSFAHKRDGQWYDATIVPRGRLFLSSDERRSIRTADIVLWGGGALIADNACRLLIPYWLVILVYIRWIARKPVFGWAQGVVLETRLGRMLAPWAFRQCDVVTVRDGHSAKRILSLKNIRRPVHCTADAALLTRIAQPEKGRRILQEAGIDPDRTPIIAIAPTFWPFYQKNSDVLPYMLARSFGLRKNRARQVTPFVMALAELADLLHEQWHARILFIPHYPAPQWNDVEHLQETKRHTRHPEHMYILEADDEPPRSFVNIWPHLHGIVAHSYHDTIVSTVSGTPCLQLHYEDKGKELFDRLHIPDTRMPWTTLLTPGGPAAVARRYADMQRRQEDVQRRIRTHMPALRQAAASTALFLRDFLSQA